MNKPSNLYFRTKDNGAAVFRVDIENRQKRLELQPIANLNLNKGQINSHSEYAPTANEIVEIEAWIAQRQHIIAQRQADDIMRLIDELNATAHWLQTKADDDTLDAVADDLLLAMHDLRSVIVRRKSAQLTNR
jgi:hypothetical protein